MVLAACRMANCWDFMRSQLDRKVDSLKTFVGLSKATNIPPGALVNYVPGRWASKVVLIVIAVFVVIIVIFIRSRIQARSVQILLTDIPKSLFGLWIYQPETPSGRWPIR